MDEDFETVEVDFDEVGFDEVDRNNDGCHHPNAGLVFGIIGLSVGAYQSIRRYGLEVRLRAQRKKTERLVGINVQKEYELAQLRKENDEIERRLRKKN